MLEAARLDPFIQPESEPRDIKVAHNQSLDSQASASSMRMRSILKYLQDDCLPIIEDNVNVSQKTTYISHLLKAFQKDT
jgi:hypothetical protein